MIFKVPTSAIPPQPCQATPAAAGGGGEAALAEVMLETEKQTETEIILYF